MAANSTKLSLKATERWMFTTARVACVADRKGSSEICLGYDLGSTGTRWRAFDNENQTMGKDYEISSDIVLVDDISNLKSPTPELYNNIEVVIRDVTPIEFKAKKFIKEAGIHFVMGGLTKGIRGGVELPKPSNVSKTQLQSTPLNILATIGLEVIRSYMQAGKELQTACFHPMLAIALPPDDFKSEKILADFKDILAGHYEVEYPRLGCSLNIKISQDNLYFEKEPNAVQYAYLNHHEEVEDETIIICDGGGKTTDYSFIFEGEFLDDIAVPGAYGGNTTLKDLIIKSYVNETGKSEPNKVALERALQTGILDRGGKKEDITKHIDFAKNQVAQMVQSSILKISDLARVSLDDVNRIVFHGGLFTNTISAEDMEEETTRAVKGNISIAEKTIELLSNIAPDIETDLITDSSVITEGVILSWWVNQ